MRMRSLWLVSVLAVVLCPLAWAQGEKEGEGGMDPAAMEKMMPGPEHEALAKQAGTWHVAMKQWQDPAQPPMEAIGTAEFTVIMDGRYLHQVYKGEMMGMPFTGWGIDGYDRVLGKYTSYWIDSMTTSSTSLTGTSKDGGKTVEYTGAMADFEGGGMVQVRWVAEHKSDDETHIDMFVQHDGQETRSMELVYTRKK